MKYEKHALLYASFVVTFCTERVGVTTHTVAAAPTVTATISVGTTPLDVGVNASTNRIYVANSTSSTVSVIDGASNTVLSTISV